MPTVELYETQLSFLDRVVEGGEHGSSREEVLRSLLLEHVNQRLAGASDHVGGTAQLDVLEIPFPEYGPKRLELTLQPVTGKAVPVMRGEVLRIEQLVGGTCVDFNAFNLHDYKEFLDCGLHAQLSVVRPPARRVHLDQRPAGPAHVRHPRDR
jgi:Domain of unknown function (DUF1989)